MRVRALLYLPAVVALTAAVALFALAQGPGLTFGRVLEALGSGLGMASAEAQDGVIVNEVLLPRVLVAILSGASLAMAGTVMQALFRNPLASPEVLGTSAGSALGAVVAIAAGLAGVSIFAAPAFAFAGASLVSIFVYLAASRAGGFSITGILLAGIAMNTLVGAVTVFFVSLSFQNFQSSAPIMFWLMGGLDLVGFPHAAIVGGGLVIFGVLSLPLLRDMDLLALREESAASLGVDIKRLRITLLIVACGMTATAVSCTGGIAFIGLVVPHMVRLMVGPSHRALIPCAAVTGSLVLLSAYCVCKMVPAESELRPGVVTSLLGAPFFFWLLIRHRRGSEL
ncbi:MAG: iron ABC transporter permease [Planctomycetota bacterium]|nr:iron ABC transporter permease [Planctomycetota bacterium]